MQYPNKNPQAHISKLVPSCAIKLVVVALAIYLIYTICHLESAVIMESSEDPSSPEVPIRVIITDILVAESQAESPTVTLKITLLNISPDTPLSFLRWSSPLDIKAGAMGLFVFTSKSSGKPAHSMNLKLNRKVPESGVYPSQDTIRLEAGGKVEKEVTIKAPEVVLERGEAYSVSVKGFWMHVVVGDHAELRTEQSGVLSGSFESEAVEIKIPG